MRIITIKKIISFIYSINFALLNLICVKNIFLSILMFVLAVANFSCHRGDNSNDIKNIKINVQFYDFYKDFAALDTNNLQAGLEKIKAKYPDFLDLYLDGLANINMNGDYSKTDVLRGFLTYPDFKNLFDTVMKVYPDTKKQDEQIEDLFKHLAFYDSSYRLPQKVFYYAAGLHYPVSLTKDNKILGIGIDCFLGRDFAPYEQVKIPYYMTLKNTPEYIPVAVAIKFYEDKYPLVFDDKNLLQLMIEKGKEAYFLKKMLPDAEENLFFLFDEKQMEWCRKNEKLIYNYFIQNNLLYETNGQKIYRYLNDAPTSSGMPPESPGNTASFIGYKIVNAYAERSGKSLMEILKMTDAKQILSAANYKP